MRRMRWHLLALALLVVGCATPTGQVGGGGATSTVPSDPCEGISCTSPPSVCFTATGTCDGGACSYTHADGASCDDGDACTTGDVCASGVCAGTQVACDTPPSECFAPDGTCAGGVCSYAHADGASCNDGDACTTGDVCAGGVCTGTPIVCDTPPSPCFAPEGTCADRVCSYSYADGASCDDGDPCTTGDVCASGVCAGTTLVCDTPPSSCFFPAGTCAHGACVYAEANGASCNDGNACTTGDICAGGVCAGTPVACNTPPSGCFAASGTCTGSGCSYAYANGAACNDGNPCTTGDVCAGGVCSGTPVACNTPPSGCFAASGTCTGGGCSYAYANGASCNDGNPCTTGDICAGGVCAGTPVACNTPPSGCFAASGTCTGGGCSYAYADGASCNDGNPCTTGDVCATGVCSGTPVTCTTPPSVCFAATGTCAGGACSYAYADGASCDDGDACTIGDVCASGVCAGTPRVCTTPPAPVCLSPSVLETWTSPGACTVGACNYAITDLSCPWGCTGVACTVRFSVAVSTGDAHTCAITGSGALECWGGNNFGQLGDDSVAENPIPFGVVGLSSGVVAVSAGGGTTCALTAQGAVTCWGDDELGQLGDGGATNSVVPVGVVGLTSGVVAISSGEDHSCAVTGAGAVQCWGSDEYGELGDGSTMSSSEVPVDVVGLSSGVVAVSAGYYHSCALTTAGAVLCWGDNESGELGDGSITDSAVPGGVVGLSSGVVAVSGGAYHTCAVTTAGAVLCWGDNDWGGLGDGSTTDSAVPVGVVGLSSGVVLVSAGFDYTCALTAAGAVLCWGANDYGELGDGTHTKSAVPVGVVGLSSGVVAISAGGTQACALTAAGAVLCWGDNTVGQLGDDSTVDSPVPVEVLGF